MYTKFDVSLLIPGLPIHPDTLDKRSLGGSESAGLYMAKALAREGARVNVFCNTAENWRDSIGVSFNPSVGWSSATRGAVHDICIAQRSLDALAAPTSARLNLLWCHDLALGRDARRVRGALWNIDRIVVLSEYMRAQYQEAYEIEPEVCFVSRNGVDLDLFREVAAGGIRRDRNKLVYAARPERGLDLLLRDVMPRLLENEPELRLYIAGYDHRHEEFVELYRECEQLARALGDRVVVLGSLSKRDLYRHFLSARVYVYPTPSPSSPGFREVSCICAMECQAAGLPVVTSALGALPETLAPEGAILTGGDPSNRSELAGYIEAFSQNVLTLVRDDERWAQASNAGMKRASSLDWSDVAREWLSEAERLIRARNNSRPRLLRHFVRTSNIISANHLSASGQPSRSDVALGEDGSGDAPCSGPPASQEKCTIGDGSPIAESAEMRALPKASKHSLIAAVRSQITALSGAAKRIVAYHSDIKEDAPTTSLAVSWPHVYVDTPGGGLRAQLAPDYQRTVTERRSLAGSEFEAAVVFDELESFERPWDALAYVEQLVEVGGRIYLTCPWEPTCAHSDSGHRPLWSFDEHDIRDMLGEKPGLSIDGFYFDHETGESVAAGWWIVSYVVDGRPIPQIDLERRSWLQRPRETLSAAIIAGPGSEDTLHWMLKSITDVADEVVISDCGMSREARRIAQAHGVRLVPGADPKRVGFDDARNEGLTHCSSDWCIWVDTDEKLVGRERLAKYLRYNVYSAYQLPLHHFACDVAIPTEYPAKLFRNQARADNRRIKFFGAIHENPEWELNEGCGPVLALPDVHVAHVGYLDEQTRRGRFARNWPLMSLDRARHPNRVAQKEFLMRDKMHLIRYALERNGGQVTDEIRVACRDIIDTYRQEFLGDQSPLNGQCLEYYSDALCILGEGFEAAFHLSAGKTRAEPDRLRRYRFATIEDLQAELSRIAVKAAGPYQSKWW
jgi:glycosyltransferase involved in cell wall biosynthesis